MIMVCFQHFGSLSLATHMSNKNLILVIVSCCCILLIIYLRPFSFSSEQSTQAVTAEIPIVGEEKRQQLMVQNLYKLKRIKCNEMISQPEVTLYSTFSMKKNFSDFPIHKENKFLLPLVEPNTFDIVCKNYTMFYALACLKNNEYQANWCTSYDYPANIVILRNAYVDWGSKDVKSAWNVFTNSTLYCLNYGIKLPPQNAKVRIKYFEKLATLGFSTYTYAFGHVAQEMLTKFLYMWTVIPKGVPILWAEGVGRKMLNDLFYLGILDPNDHPVEFHKSGDPLYFAAKELFVHHYPEHDSNIVSLYMSPGTLLLANKILTSKFANPRNSILVLSRKDAASRHLSNYDQIVSKLRERFGDVNDIVEVVPAGKRYIEMGRMFYDARLVIAPHGAGLSHLLFMRCGTAIIEFGWYHGDFPTPNEYYCFARAIGVKYGLVMGEGTYYSHLTPNVEETMQMVEKMLKKGISCEAP